MPLQMKEFLLRQRRHYNSFIHSLLEKTMSLGQLTLTQTISEMKYEKTHLTLIVKTINNASKQYQISLEMSFLRSPFQEGAKHN